MKLTESELKALRKSKASGKRGNYMSKSQLEAIREKNRKDWKPIEYYKMYSLQSQDGTTFGEVSEGAYVAIESGTLDSYKPKNDEEKKTIDEFRKHHGITLKSQDGTEFGKISYDAYQAFANNKIGEYTPYSDAEKKAISDFKTYAETKAKEERINSNPVFARYGIDPADFDYDDLVEWGKQHNHNVYFVLQGSNAGPNIEPLKEGGFLGIGAKSKASQQEEADAKVLFELLNNTTRKNMAQADMGAIMTAFKGVANGMSFGAFDAALEYGSKQRYQKAGLADEDYVSTSQAWDKTTKEHPIANFVGETTGSVVALSGLSSAVSTATKGVGWIAKSPQWVQSAINSGITFSIAGGAETAFDGGNLKEVLTSAGINFVGGSVGGALSSKVGAIGEKILFNKGLQHKVIPEMIRNGFSSAAFAGGKVASTYFLYPKEYRPTAEELAKDIGVAFAFGAISSGINTMKASAQNKKYLDDLYQKMASDYENMAKAKINSKSDVAGIREFAKNVVGYSNAMEAYLTGKEFSATIDGNTYTFTPNKVRLVGQDKYVKSILAELQTVRNGANAVLNGVGAPTTDVATTSTSGVSTAPAVVPTLPSGSVPAGDTSTPVPPIVSVPPVSSSVTSGTSETTRISPVASSGELDEIVSAGEIAKFTPESASGEMKRLENILIEKGADDTSRQEIIGAALEIEKALAGSDKTIRSVFNNVSRITSGAVTEIRSKAGVSGAYWKLFGENFKAIPSGNVTNNVELITEYATAYTEALKNSNPEKYNTAVVSTDGKDLTVELPTTIMQNVIPSNAQNAGEYKLVATQIKNIVSEVDIQITAERTEIYGAETNTAESSVVKPDVVEKVSNDTDVNRTVAYTNDNERIDLGYKVVSVDDLIASNELDGRVNPDYPQELQPRDRQRTSSQSQIQQMAYDLNPARLGESTNVSEGSPIVGADNVVESGNGRTLAIKLAYKLGTADEYRNHIVNNAGKYGIDVSNLPEKPILVRERLTEVDRVAFTRKANESSIASLSATEQAKVDAENLTNDVLDLLVANDDGKINTPDNKDFVSTVITKVFKNEDLNNVVNADNMLSQRGLERITNAIFYKAYGDASLSARLSESLDNDMKNATNVLLNIAPKVVYVKNGIASNALHDFDFSSDIASAVRLFEECRNRNTTVSDYAAQTSLFDKESQLVMAMAYIFETKNRGAKQATDFYNSLLDGVISLGDPNQISFGIVDTFETKEALFNAIRKQYNAGVDARQQITIPESIYGSDSITGRDDDGRGIYEVAGNDTTSSQENRNAVGVQQDNGPGEETRVATDDAELRQTQESVEGQSEKVTSVTESTEYNHIYDEKKVSKEYLDSVNPEIENAIISIRNGNIENIPDVINVTELDEKTIKAISDFVGYDISGYACKIERDRLVHIENRHGINGEHDQSLSDPKDTARMGYVVNNSDNIDWAVDGKGNRVFDKQYNDKNNKPSPVIMLNSKIDGTYCVSQAVPDSKKKTVWITSARIQKKAAVGSQVPYDSNATPQLQTSETPLNSSSASADIVSQGNDVVNNNETKTLNLTDKCELVATKHTATGNDIWVVTLKDKLSSEEYKDLSGKVKTVGGYYSRFAKSLDGKAIPGFVFKTEPTAKEIKVFNDFFTEEALSNQAENDTNKEGVKDVESQSEVLAGESGTDDRGLRSGTSETSKQETTERVDGQSGENSGEVLSQSTGTDGNGPDVRNDGEGVHRGNDADVSDSEATGNVTETSEEQPETVETEDKSIEKKRPSNKENFVITDDIAREFDNTPPSAEDNIKAIELLLTLENEGRPATAEEKKVLAKYKGWGGIDIRRLPWELSRKVYDLYQGEQLRAMQSSESNAFFTPTGVIDAMYNGLKRMGFKGGNVLESSMGVGNFFGRMPVAMTSKSALTGVELETYTARIAQYLYPGATVINKPFQDVAIRNGSYDLVIGNVPFGTTKISYNKKKYSLHNYFIISSLDKVKDGGVVAVITSASTLDSYTLDTRKAIMDRADVVACYKLPAGVFSRNASTDVQTDLLILKKRASDAKPSGDSILNVTTTDDGLRLNEYFVKHPENVLGTLAKGTNAWGEITTVLDNGDFYGKLDDAMKKLPKDLISGKVELKPIETIVTTSSKPRFFEKNGKIYADDGAGTATSITNASQEKTIRDYMVVRDAYKDLLAAYESDMPESDIKPLRDALTTAYDNFSEKHGAITGDGKKKIGNKKSQSNTFLEADSDYYLVSGLERYNKDEKKIEKSELFEKDTLRKKKVTSVDSASDALAVSLNESGKIDFARMSELTGKNEKQLVEELKGEIVLTPDGDYVLTDIYLSGNIYEKIDAVKDKPDFKEQKEMLEKVLPTPKDASSIMVKLGANYIEPKYIEDFSREVFNERISVSKNSSGAWSIEGVRQLRWGDILNVKYGCDKFNAIQLLEKVLNDSEIIANKKIQIDGKSVDVFDEKMTEVARQKAQDIRDAFESWIFKDSERRTDIVDKYNRTYNNYRPLDYERISDKLSFDSMNETLKAKLYPHQKKGIARFLFGGNILFAHGVGTGKTFEMIASVMEAKRMGIINKAAMVVPNNKVVDFKNDIAEAYPNAKVLVIDTTDKKRQTMLGLVNSNDWDIVLIARTTFTKIPVSAEMQQNYINQQIEDFDRQIAEAEYDRSISKRALDGLKKQRDTLAQKLKDLDSETKRDENSVEFEKLGFDCICVDEAHNYKSITTPTKLNIKGLASGSDAQQANDMLMKLDYMRSIDGRIIFGTGTPITNTVAEIYNMMRMVSPDILEDAGIHSLDEWVNTFANIETITEIGIDNKIKNKSTQVIRNFVNATEMVGMFRQFADVVFTQDVVKNLPKAKYISIELDGTDVLRQIESEISNAIANASGTETLKVYTKVMAMANAAAIDPKMLSGADSDVNIFKDYSLEELEYEDSKVNTMCNIVYDKYKASNDIKGTQIVFCDGGAGSGKIYSFNVHNDIKQKLIERGIPENEIVIVKNQKNAQLEELYDKVNSGEVRVLIGTSRKMAEGLNVQKRVVSIHHPTVTFKPSDLEQGDARGVRAGNINEEVEIYRYLQGNTFDSYKWQAIDRKGAMINAALRGESIDELEDIGADEDSDAGVDAATAMAITSGNPLVKEKIDIDKEVKRLKTLKQNFMNEYYRYQDVVAKNPSQIRQLTERVQRMERDIDLRNKYGDKAVTSIKGKTFEKQTDANKALLEAVKTAPKNGQFTKIGEYNGFDIMFKGDTGGQNYSLILKGANEYSVEYAGNGNNIARIAGVLKRLDADLKRLQGTIEHLKSDLEFAKQEVNKPFEKEKDLTEALEKQKDITYRYEHFGESKSTEQMETEEAEGAETVHYSKRSVESTSEEENRWVAERVESVEKSKGNKNNTVNIGDIVKTIREKFDIPIATGKVTNPEASAQYNERAESIRTRIANNLPDIAHELGHHLDKKYELSKFDSVKALRKAVSEDFLSQYSADEKNGEAVSEFVRTYLKSTNEANRLCGEFYDDFVSTLSKEDLKAVKEIANAINEYMSYDFSRRVRASIVSGDVKEKTSLSEKAKKAYADWVDGFLPIKDVVEYVEETTGTTLSGRRNAYTLATNSLNARAIANFNTVHGFRDLNGNIVDGAKSFIECIANVNKKDLSTLDEYLVLKHSLEWIAPKNEDATVKRVFADDTLEDVESIEERIAMIETSFPEMKEAAENLYEYQRNILKHIVMPAGGMTEDTFNSLNEKYPCYVPFYRAIGKDGAKTKGSFANQKSPIKRAKGSGELILSPLESIIKNTDKMVKFALRNQTMQVLTSYADTVDGFGKFMEKVPPDMLPHTTDISFLKDKFEDALQQAVSSGDDYFAVSGLFDEIFGNTVTDFTPIANSNKKIVTVLANGTFSYYQIHDEDLYEAVAEFTPKNLKGLFALSHKLMQPMKLLITQSNFVFGTTNFFRDIGTAYKHSPINNPAEFAKKYILAAKEIITKGDKYKQWQAMGGGHHSELSASLDQIKETLRQVAQKDMGKAKRLLYSIICHPIATIAALNDYIESTPRLMEFMRTLEAGGDLQEAIYNADDITTNFKRSGKGSFAKDMNALVMFNNAALQGLDKTARTLTNKNKAERNKTLLKWALSALLMAVIQAFWNKSNDDEGYKNLSSHVKNNFYNFSTGDGNFISIPKARETALLDSFTERTIEYVFGNDDAFYEFGAYVSEQILPPMIPSSLNPVDAAHDVLGSTVLGGLADVGWNKNYMDVPIEGKYDEYLPSNERYDEKTTKVAYALGQTKLARMMDLSPKKIDHLISSYTGIIGQMNKALFPMNKENRDATIGLRNKFIKDSNYSTDLLNKAYDNRDKAKLQWQYKDNIENAIEYEQNSLITSYISGMNKAIKALPEDEQREGRKYLLKTLNAWNYSTTTQQSNMLSNLEGEVIDKNVIFEELPDSEISWTVKKQKYTYQMTPQEYNEYVTVYLNAIENARKKYGSDSPESYEKAKEAAKDYMSKHKKSLTSKYRNKAIKTE